MAAKLQRIQQNSTEELHDIKLTLDDMKMTNVINWSPWVGVTFVTD